VHAAAVAAAVVSSRTAVVAPSAVLVVGWAEVVDGSQLVAAKVSQHSARMETRLFKKMCTWRLRCNLDRTHS